MNKNKQLEIKKIPLRGLIDMLINIYNNDVDYVNMMVEKGDHQDTIWLVEDNSKNQKYTEIKKGTINFEDLG